MKTVLFLITFGLCAFPVVPTRAEEPPADVSVEGDPEIEIDLLAEPAPIRGEGESVVDLSVEPEIEVPETLPDEPEAGEAAEAAEAVVAPAEAEAVPVVAEEVEEAEEAMVSEMESAPAEVTGDGELSIEAVESSLEASLATTEETPSASVTVNLIRKLVERGILGEREAVDLIRQAEAEAALVQAQKEAVEAAAEQVQRAAAAEAELAGEDAIRVTYVPEYVRDEIATDVRNEVLGVEADYYVQKADLPLWLDRFDFYGDIRVRGEDVNFPVGNDNTGSFPDFNAINTGDPFDVTGLVFSPQFNVDEDRERYRVRARLGMDIDVDGTDPIPETPPIDPVYTDDWIVGLRLATGSDNSPVSTNQTLSDNFEKFQIWLDRAFIRYEGGTSSRRKIAVTVGRFDNPFFTRSIVFDDDLGFDGVAIEGRFQPIERFIGFVPWFAAGAFPIFNTSFNFPSNFPSKFESDDRYMYGGQIGLDFKPHRQIDTKVAVGYFDFQKVEGKLSTPFVPFTPDDPGDTDTRRPTFAQKGNTYMPLRDIIPVPANGFGTTMQYQYFGLATPFRIVTADAEVTFSFFDPIQITLYGEYGYNIAFDEQNIDAIAVNNRGPLTAGGTLGAYDGGPEGWIAGLVVGHPDFAQQWNWRLGTDYRYVETDAFVDGFVDSDFGLGGTNVQGWSFAGQLAIDEFVWLGARFMSSREITGSPFRADTLQIDISVKY